MVKIEGKLMHGCGWALFVLFMVCCMPIVSFAGMQLHFEWDPNPEPDIAGYRFFSRQPGQDYNYDDPVWEGEENNCSIFVDDQDAVYFYVVRAFDEEGFESGDSNEVVYPDDSRYLNGYSSSSDAGGCFIGVMSDSLKNHNRKSRTENGPAFSIFRN